MDVEAFPLPSQIAGIRGGPHFLLHVPDDSMAKAGIAAGDWVIVRSQATGAPCDVVAVMESGTAIVTTWKRRRTGTTVLGVVVSVIHQIPSSPAKG